MVRSIFDTNGILYETTKNITKIDRLNKGGMYSVYNRWSCYIYVLS